MKRTIGLAVLGVTVLIGLGGCGGGGGGKTPQEAFDKMVEAAKKEDTKAFMNTLTKDSQRAFSGGMVTMLAMSKAAAEFAPGKIDVASLDEVMKKHGLTEEKFKELSKDDAKEAGDAVEALKKAGDLVKDQPAFVSDSIAAMKKLGKGKGDDPFTEIGQAKVKDIKVEGDKATGKIEKGSGKEDEIHFAKEGGAWKIDLIPSFKKKG